MTDPQGTEAADGDGLIDPEHFVIGADYVALAAGQIEQAGTLLTALAERVVDPMTEISSSWWRLPGCYEAPEQSQVYLLMNPAVTEAEAMATDFSAADRHLQTYATAVLAEQENLRDLTARATAFRSAVVGGVEVPVTHRGASMAPVVEALGGTAPTEVVPWNHDEATASRNASLLEEHAAIAARINAAAVACANDIDTLVRALPNDHAPAEAFGEDALADSRAPMPWGYPREPERDVEASIRHGFYRFLANGVIAAGALGGFDVENDWERTPGLASQSWAGLGDALGSLVVAASLIPYSRLTPLGDRAVVGALPAGAQEWVHRREEVATGTLAGLVGIDYESHLAGEDGMWMWREDAVATATESVLNVGTMFIGPGGAVRGGSSAALRSLRVVTGAADFVVPGTSFLVHGGIGVVRGLQDAVRTGDLQPVALVDDTNSAQRRPRSPSAGPAEPTSLPSSDATPRTGVHPSSRDATPTEPSWVTSDHIAPTPEQQHAFAEAVELGPHRPELWIDLGNPNRSSGSAAWTRNCGPCARSFADAFQGREAFAAYGDGRPNPSESLEMWRALGTQSPPLHVNVGRMDPDDFTADAYARLESDLLQEGPGAVAIVGIDWHSGNGGHFFNAYVNPAGDVWWADLQSGELAPWPPPYLQRIHQIDAVTRGTGADTWNEVTW